MLDAYWELVMRLMSQLAKQGKPQKSISSCDGNVLKEDCVHDLSGCEKEKHDFCPIVSNYENTHINQ